MKNAHPRPERSGEMKTLFLTPDELADLTDYQPNQTACHIRWLDRNKYPFELSRLGRPKVLRAYVEKRHQVAANDSPEHTVQPDFS